MGAREIQKGRYFRRTNFNLDYDGGGYTNSYSIFDGDKDTGIADVASGHSSKPDSHKRHITFDGRDFATLREAIIAYEDAASASTEMG